MKNLSKNKMMVDGIELTQQSEPVDLKAKSAFLISKIKAYFLLPKEAAQS